MSHLMSVVQKHMVLGYPVARTLELANYGSVRLLGRPNAQGLVLVESDVPDFAVRGAILQCATGVQSARLLYCASGGALQSVSAPSDQFDDPQRYEVLRRLFALETVPLFVLDQETPITDALQFQVLWRAYALPSGSMVAPWKEVPADPFVVRRGLVALNPETLRLTPPASALLDQAVHQAWQSLARDAGSRGTLLRIADPVARLQPPEAVVALLRGSPAKSFQGQGWRPAPGLKTRFSERVRVIVGQAPGAGVAAVPSPQVTWIQSGPLYYVPEAPLSQGLAVASSLVPGSVSVGYGGIPSATGPTVISPAAGTAVAVGGPTSPGVATPTPSFVVGSTGAPAAAAGTAGSTGMYPAPPQMGPATPVAAPAAAPATTAAPAPAPAPATAPGTPMGMAIPGTGMPVPTPVQTPAPTFVPVYVPTPVATPVPTPVAMPAATTGATGTQSGAPGVGVRATGPGALIAGTPGATPIYFGGPAPRAVVVPPAQPTAALPGPGVTGTTGVAVPGTTPVPGTVIPGAGATGAGGAPTIAPEVLQFAELKRSYDSANEAWKKAYEPEWRYIEVNWGSLLPQERNYLAAQFADQAALAKKEGNLCTYAQSFLEALADPGSHATAATAATGPGSASLALRPVDLNSAAALAPAALQAMLHIQEAVPPTDWLRFASSVCPGPSCARRYSTATLCSPSPRGPEALAEGINVYLATVYDTAPGRCADYTEPSIRLSIIVQKLSLGFQVRAVVSARGDVIVEDSLIRDVVSRTLFGTASSGTSGSTLGGGPATAATAAAAEAKTEAKSEPTLVRTIQLGAGIQCTCLLLPKMWVFDLSDAETALLWLAYTWAQVQCSEPLFAALWRLTEPCNQLHQAVRGFASRIDLFLSQYPRLRDVACQMAMGTATWTSVLGPTPAETSAAAAAAAPSPGPSAEGSVAGPWAMVRWRESPASSAPECLAGSREAWPMPQAAVYSVPPVLVPRGWKVPGASDLSTEGRAPAFSWIDIVQSPTAVPDPGTLGQWTKPASFEWKDLTLIMPLVPPPPDYPPDIQLSWQFLEPWVHLACFEHDSSAPTQVVQVGRVEVASREVGCPWVLQRSESVITDVQSPCAYGVLRVGAMGAEMLGCTVIRGRGSGLQPETMHLVRARNSALATLYYSAPTVAVASPGASAVSVAPTALGAPVGPGGAAAAAAAAPTVAAESKAEVSSLAAAKATATAASADLASLSLRRVARHLLLLGYARGSRVEATSDIAATDDRFARPLYALLARAADAESRRVLRIAWTLMRYAQVHGSTDQLYQLNTLAERLAYECLVSPTFTLAASLAYGAYRYLLSERCILQWVATAHGSEWLDHQMRTLGALEAHERKVVNDFVDSLKRHMRFSAPVIQLACWELGRAFFNSPRRAVSMSAGYYSPLAIGAGSLQLDQLRRLAIPLVLPDVPVNTDDLDQLTSFRKALNIRQGAAVTRYAEKLKEVRDRYNLESGGRWNNVITENEWLHQWLWLALGEQYPLSTLQRMLDVWP